MSNGLPGINIGYSCGYQPTQFEKLKIAITSQTLFIARAHLGRYMQIM